MAPCEDEGEPGDHGHGEGGPGQGASTAGATESDPDVGNTADDEYVRSTKDEAEEGGRPIPAAQLWLDPDVNRIARRARRCRICHVTIFCVSDPVVQGPWSHAAGSTAGSAA